MRGVALAILLSASVAGAAPWKLETDFDGSAPSQIKLDAEGRLTIVTAGNVAELRVADSVTRATLQAAHTLGTPTIVVEVTTPAGNEAVVIQMGPRGWKEVARSAVGPVGIDAEYTTEVIATASGVYRYETRPGYHRCDNKPALLFAEELGGKEFRPLMKAPADLPANAAVVTARADSAPQTTPIVFQARAASYQVGATNAGALSIPRELDDGKPGTMWLEDLPGSAGEGEFFTFERRVGNAKAVQLRIVPATTAKAKPLNRPKRLGVVWATGAAHVDLPDAANDAGGTAYVADLPAAVDGCVTVIIESTYGPANGQTAIAELEVFAEGERAGGGEALLAAAVAAGSDGERAAAQELGRRGALGAAAIDAELGKNPDARARRRLVRALVGVKDPAAGPLLARAVSQGYVEGQELVDTIVALGALGQIAPLHELALQEGLDIAARIAAVHALAPDPKAVIDVAGVGPRALRRAVIDLLAKSPAATLAPAAQQAQSPAAAGDLWRAVTRHAHAHADERAAALAAMTAALPSATDYERRFRLIEGIATIGDAQALQAIQKLLAGLPADASTAAYEQAVARAIADEPRAEALPLVLEFARDRDAGVRLSALGALASPWTTDAAAIDHAIETTLASDGWPEVRRRAAQVMGGRCARPEPARALETAFARDPEAAVRGEALSALVDCKASGVGELLAKTWNDSKQPLELRERAVDLSAPLGDRSLADRLAQDFAHWRGAALDSTAALALAQNAAYAIGRLAAPGGATALEAGLADGSFPEIVAASATGLGLLGKSCPASAKAKLKELAKSDDEQISLAATRAAAICGK